MVAIMIIVGFSIAEITELSSSLNQNSIVDANVFGLFQGEVALDNGHKLKDLLETILAKKGLNPDITLGELYETTQKSLEVVVTDLNMGSVIYVSEKNYPNFSVVSAALASMAFPGAFPPIKSPDGTLWADGAILDVYPISKFDATCVLGFSFLHASVHSQDTDLTNFFGILSRSYHLLSRPQVYISWTSMSQEHRRKTILIDVGYATTFSVGNMGQDERENLLNAGKEAVLLKSKEWRIVDEVGDFEDKNPYENFEVSLPIYLKRIFK